MPSPYFAGDQSFVRIGIERLVRCFLAEIVRFDPAQQHYPGGRSNTDAYPQPANMEDLGVNTMAAATCHVGPIYPYDMLL
jgi:hypothetical protein